MVGCKGYKRMKKQGSNWAQTPIKKKKKQKSVDIENKELVSETMWKELFFFLMVLKTINEEEIYSW